MMTLNFSLLFLILLHSIFNSASCLNHYETLGVSKNAKSKEIKAAFRSLALKTHPDKNPSEEAAKEFSSISVAYETLSDTRKRQIYDAELEQEARGFNQFNPHHQQRRRGSHQGRHFIFRQNGRTFVFTEEEYYARQQQNPFGQQYYHQQSIFNSDLIIPILKNLLMFGVIWFILRASMEGEGDPDTAAEAARRNMASAPPPHSPGRQSSNYSEFTTNDSSESTEPKEDTTANIDVLTAFKKNERVRLHAPHLNYFDTRYLKQRGRRHVIFIPRNFENILEWQTYEQIALNFIHDRLSFYWLSLKHDKKWRQFIEYEFQTYQKDGVTPLVVVFGGTSGSKRTCFYCSDDDLPITPMSSTKERVSRFLEGIVEGTQELTYTDCDLPHE